MLEDLDEPIQLTVAVRVEGRSKTLYDFKQQNSLVQHTPAEVEDRLALLITRATREIRDSGFTAIELARIRSARDRARKALNFPAGVKSGK